MQRALHQRLHRSSEGRHHQPGADAAGEDTHAQRWRAGGLADQRQATGTEGTGQHRRVAGTEAIGGERRHQRGQQKADQRQCTNDADDLRRQRQLGANGRHEQAKGEAREAVADRDQRCAEQREPCAGN